MPELNRAEKFLVNRRGTRSLARTLDLVESTGGLGLTPESRVLELGTGNGRLALLVHQRYHPATIRATDFDAQQLAVARKNLLEALGAIPPEIILERADATALDYPEGSFDLVMAHYVLHHLGSRTAIQRGLDEIARVLRPKGRLFYLEIFRTRSIREDLVHRGFRVVLRRRAFRLFTIGDIVVVERTP